MLRFFSKIRHKLLEQSKVRSYLLYAVGEIALVMVGILLALQVNNWNENRILEKTELQLLADIRENLIASRQDLMAGRQMNLLINKNNKLIQATIDQNLPLTDSLSVAFGTLLNWHSPFFTYTAYESLKSKGLDLIRNKELKKSISMMYEYKFEFLINDVDKSEWEFNDVKLPMVLKYVRFSDTTATATFIDYEGIKKDPEFLNMLARMIQVRSGGLREYENTIQKLGQLITQIEEEINKRS